MKRAYADFAVAAPAAERVPMTDTLPPSRIWRPDIGRTQAHRADLGGDILGAQFDRGVALVGYGLLIISVFTAGLPALAALALASAHSHDAHLVTRSHYRHQVSIFWAGVMSFVLGILCGVAAAAFAFSQVWSWMAAQFPWIAQNIGALVLPGDRGEVASWLVVAAVVLFIYGAAHTLLTSIFGAMKLVAGRPIGHIHED